MYSIHETTLQLMATKTSPTARLNFWMLFKCNQQVFDPHDPRLEMTAVQRFTMNVEGKGSLGKEKLSLYLANDSYRNQHFSETLEKKYCICD